MTTLAVEDVESISAFINTGAFAIVVWVIRHVFVVMFPSLTNQFQKTLDDTRKEYLESLQRIHNACHEDSEKTRQMFLQLMRNERKDKDGD